jgi:hypothetical protein
MYHIVTIYYISVSKSITMRSMKIKLKGCKMKNLTTNKMNELFPRGIFGEMEQEMDRMMNIFKRVPGNRIENNFIPSCEVSEKRWSLHD